ncbi:hypothetical protein Z517_10653 [Fonsecaea pedrosoi CBS 271.37]|uniref:Uncharacterized protein n=1 Tax=Fonsecaea pedrosoi CBS 271.37 TaxID=1442368 RepID=A0A0D2G5E4_9EURO|nr:uncharacterized protein Z517_10653 [Fonsecaea pedrosoi CBS 271.37]KIW75908.1 hypothetical protein Z517_10653 [Fonsecaea pedrosoi CBS 271.37]
MLPLSALIILGIVGVFSTLTFLFAVYHTIKTTLEAGRLKSAELDINVSLPLTETTVAPEMTVAIRRPIPSPVLSPPPIERARTPEAESPPPLPRELELEDVSVPQTSVPLPSANMLHPRMQGEEPSIPLHGKFGVQMDDFIRAETPPPLPPTSSSDLFPHMRKERDSMHEIYEIYSKLPPGPKSAPARITTFAMAESKWAYFGQKRAEDMELV